MPYTETLATYRTRFLREVRDQNQDYFTSTADIDAWIQEAQRWRDLWSGGSRSYRAGVALTATVDQYSLSSLFPNDTVLDIANLWLLWGNWRVPMDERPFGEVTNVYRPWLSYSNIPGAYCRYGATSVFIATAPSTGYTTDWDVIVLSARLAAASDVDPLPYPYTEPLVKYAVYLGFENMKRYEWAEAKYQEAIRALRDIEGSRVGELPLASVTQRGTRT